MDLKILILYGFMWSSTNAEQRPPQSCEDSFVELAQGCIFGKTRFSILTADAYCSFESTPFANSKTGEIIQAPLGPNRWHEKTGKKRNRESNTKSIENRNGNMFLNIYSPVPPSLIDIPKRVVMLSCHDKFTPSDVFQKKYSPDYLITHDVVVVTFNCTFESGYGRQKESLALKWLENNIKSFGGDVDDILIFGNGSRTSSINYHVFSPISMGVFSKCVLQNTRNMWKFTKDPRDTKNSLGKLLLHTGPRESFEFSNYLNSLLSDSIAFTTSDVVLYKVKSGADGESKNLKARGFKPYFYYTSTTIESTRRQFEKPTPIICPLREEDYAILLELVAFPAVIEIINNRLPELIKVNLFDMNMGRRTIEEICKVIRKYYFNSNFVNESHYFEIVDFYTDLAFTKYLHHSVAKAANSNSVDKAVIPSSREGIMSYVRFLESISILSPTIMELSLASTSPCSKNIISLTQGELVGRGNRSVLTGKEYCSYVRIPYAKAPVGDLRFQVPQEHEGWTGIYEAVNEGQPCMQKGIMKTALTGEEDCLFLNVFTPECPSEMNSTKAVMVFIHGGAFRSGSASASADYLMNHDVILVTLQYRLLSLGFLDLGIPECSGNVGMKDQVLALKWVQRNIRLFGGDADRVTIFGVSSGAKSVNFHMFSPLSKGLFARAIMQSGNAITPSVSVNDHNEVIEELASQLNYNKHPIDKYEFLKYLKDLDVKVLIEASYNVTDKLFEKYPGKSASFAPSIEKIKDGAFLPDDPIELSKQGVAVPVIISFVERECTWLIRYFGGTINLLDKINNQLPRVLEENLKDLNLDNRFLQEVSRKVKEFYFQNETVDERSFLDIVDLYSDLRYIRTSYKSIWHILNSSHPVYAFRFSFKSYLNLSTFMTFTLRRPMVERKATLQYGGHEDDIVHLLYVKSNSIVTLFFHKEPDLTVINSMCKLWTNFAKNGNPNGDNLNFTWTPTTIENPSHLVLDSKFHEVLERMFEKRLKFWDEIEKLHATKK